MGGTNFRPYMITIHHSIGPEKPKPNLWCSRFLCQNNI